jgi:hypothetical protein
MKQSQQTKSGATTRALLWVGLIAPLLCIAVFTIDGATRPDYSQLHHWISHLSLGSRGWLGAANLAVTGIALIAFSIGMHRSLTTGKGSKWAPRLISMAGIGFIVASIFNQDPGLGYPQGVEAVTGSATDGIHGIAALLLFSSLTAVCFVLARRFNGGLRRYSIISPYIIIVSFIACSVLVTLDYASAWPGAPSGLLERVALISALVYVSVIARYLLSETPKTK